MTSHQALRSLWLPVATAALLVSVSGCFDDTCDPVCRAGYSCYYGVCLSRGFCPEGDPNAEPEPHCVARDDAGVCTDVRGLCREGYSCECTFIDADGSCSQRQCMPFDEVTE